MAINPTRLSQESSDFHKIKQQIVAAMHHPGNVVYLGMAGHMDNNAPVSRTGSCTIWMVRTPALHNTIYGFIHNSDNRMVNPDQVTEFDSVWTYNRLSKETWIINSTAHTTSTTETIFKLIESMMETLGNATAEQVLEKIHSEPYSNVSPKRHRQ